MIMSVSMDSTDMLLVTLLVILVGYFLFQKQSESSSNSNVSTRLGKNSRAKSKRGWPTFTLIESIDLSEDSKQLKLKIPNGTKFSLPVGRHVMMRAKVGDEQVVRPYTPISLPHEIKEHGCIDLVIKKYGLGKLSSHLHACKVGDKIEVMGPIGTFKFTPNMSKHAVMISGGTGLTPVLALTRAMCLLGKDDDTTIHFIFQNRKEADILCVDMLEKLAAEHSDRLHMYFFLSRGQESKTTSSSSVPRRSGYGCSAEFLGSLVRDIHAQPVQLTGDGDVVGEGDGVAEIKYYVCGPSGFEKATMDTLKELNIDEQLIHKF